MRSSSETFHSVQWMQCPFIAGFRLIMKISGIFPLALSSVFPASAMAEPSSLEPMTILATRSEKSSFETAGSDAVLTYDELSRQGSTTLGSALKYVPGVSVPFDFTGADPLVPYLGGGEKSINIRGMEGNRISISLDGIRQPQEFFVAGGMAGPGRVYFDPATLSQLELYKSASSSLYGNESMGGSLNGRTVSPIALLGEEILGSAGSNELTYTSVNRSFGNRLTAGQGNGIWAVSAVYSYREGHERINNSSILSDPQEFDVVFQNFAKGLGHGKRSFDQYTFTDVNHRGADPMNFDNDKKPVPLFSRVTQPKRNWVSQTNFRCWRMFRSLPSHRSIRRIAWITLKIGLEKSAFKRISWG